MFFILLVAINVPIGIMCFIVGIIALLRKELSSKFDATYNDIYHLIFIGILFPTFITYFWVKDGEIPD